jgi:O-antigen/teichoic acid export membrane protein
VVSAIDRLPTFAPYGRRFIRNVVWNWLSSGLALLAGLFLSPLLIHKLGPDGYGVWVLCFALVEYYWLFDLGFRSAVVKFVAHYAAMNDEQGVNRVVSTALVVGTATAAAIMTVVFAGSGHVEQWFRIPDAYRESFPRFLELVTVSWCVGAFFSTFSQAIEARQQFHLTNRVAIVTMAVRTLSTFALLLLGFGLIPIGIAVIASQILGYAINYVQFWRVFPTARLSWRLASASTLREMAQFGLHSFTANIAAQVLNHGPLLIIGHFAPAAYVGFFGFPSRVLQYGVDFVGRIGLVTNAAAADLAAREDNARLRILAIYPNRYGLVMFMPLAIFLWTRGDQIVARWVGEAFAVQSAPVLRILLPAYALAMVGQFGSSMLLMGMGKLRRYARGLVVEAVVVILALWWLVPRYGITGAAWGVAVAMLAVRGVVASRLVCREIGLAWPSYLRLVYATPLVAAIVPAAVSFLFARTVLPADTWPQLAAHACLIGVTYVPLAWTMCVEREHKVLLQSWLWRRPRSRRNAPAAH